MVSTGIVIKGRCLQVLFSIRTKERTVLSMLCMFVAVTSSSTMPMVDVLLRRIHRGDGTQTRRQIRARVSDASKASAIERWLGIPAKKRLSNGSRQQAIARRWRTRRVG